MINANELRRGNLITDVWAEPGNMFKVKYIQRGCTYGNDLKSAYENLRPIPLTEDILLKAGFNKTIYNRDSGYAQLGLNVNGIDLMFCIECNSNRPDFYLNMVGVDILYLHQLQNLFQVLTGKELEIHL